MLEGNRTATQNVSASNVPRAQLMFAHMSALMSVAREALHTFVDRMRLQADKSRRYVEFQVGQQVLLSTYHIYAEADVEREQARGTQTPAPLHYLQT